MKVYHFRLVVEARFTVKETAYLDTLQPLAAERRSIDKTGIVEYLAALQDGGTEFETHLQLVCAYEEE